MPFSITVPWLALLGQVFTPLVSMVSYLSGGPLDNLFQLRFQSFHYSFDGLWEFLQLGQSLKWKIQKFCLRQTRQIVNVL